MPIRWERLLGNAVKGGKCGQRLLVVVFIIFLCVLQGYAVTIEEGAFNIFAKVGANSSSNDEPSHIVETDDNIVIVAGTSSPIERGSESDLGQPLHDGLGEEDIFIAKVNATDGVVLWVYRDGTSKEDRLHALLLDTNRTHMFVGGRTFGTFSNTTRKGQADIFVIKYDISGNRPEPVWDTPLILGTTASESISSLTFDPNDENVVYATGFTSGKLFSTRNTEPLGQSDAVLFSFTSLAGLVVHSVQFGSQYADKGTGLVISDKEDGPIFVSVITDRQIGQYAFGNFHMYKFKRDMTPLGDLLLKTYSREQMASFHEHPMLPGTLLGSGSSWLDSRNGYDVFVKRIVRVFDDSDIGSKEIDIDEVSNEEYTKRIRSPDGGHDYATDMLVDSESGRLVISGYSGGTFAPGAQKTGLLEPFIASIDPVDASLTDAKQMTLRYNNSWVEIMCMTMTASKRGVYYVAKESNETSHRFFLHVGSFGFPATWKERITIVPSPDPTPSPKLDHDKSNAKAEKSELPIAIIAGSACGAVVFIAIVLAAWQQMRKRSIRAKPQPPDKKTLSTKPRRSAGIGTRDGIIVGRNASGLV